jgi:bacteriorhodopsin
MITRMIAEIMFLTVVVVVTDVLWRMAKLVWLSGDDGGKSIQQTKDSVISPSPRS